MNPGKKPSKIVSIAVGLFVLCQAPAWAGCKSAMDSPEWPNVARAISTAQLCEQLPMGPNRTSGFRVLSADICSSGDGRASIRTTALLTCETGDDALFQMAPVEGKVIATVSLDVGACRITDTRIEIEGEIGSLLSGLPDTQDFGRNWAQSQLSHLCQLR
jgi:hypothetical protein